MKSAFIKLLLALTSLFRTKSAVTEPVEPSTSLCNMRTLLATFLLLLENANCAFQTFTYLLESLGGIKFALTRHLLAFTNLCGMKYVLAESLPALTSHCRMKTSLARTSTNLCWMQTLLARTQLVYVAKTDCRSSSSLYLPLRNANVMWCILACWTSTSLHQPLLIINSYCRNSPSLHHPWGTQIPTAKVLPAFISLFEG